MALEGYIDDDILLCHGCYNTVNLFTHKIKETNIMNTPTTEEIKAQLEELKHMYAMTLVNTVCDFMERIDDLNEDAGYLILGRLRKHFHFEGSLYGRGDFEASLGRELTNDEWKKIYSSTEFYYELGEPHDGDMYAIAKVLEDLGFGA
jgi:hypothetical protein